MLGICGGGGSPLCQRKSLRNSDGEESPSRGGKKRPQPITVPRMKQGREKSERSLTALIGRTAGSHVETREIAGMTVLLRRLRPGGNRKRRTTFHVTGRAIQQTGGVGGGRDGWWRTRRRRRRRRMKRRRRRKTARQLHEKE